MTIFAWASLITEGNKTLLDLAGVDRGYASLSGALQCTDAQSAADDFAIICGAPPTILLRTLQIRVRVACTKNHAKSML